MTPAALVERLREIGNGVEHDDIKPAMNEAAALITAMQTQIDQTILCWQHDKRTAETNWNNAQATIKRLEKELALAQEQKSAALHCFRKEQER